MTDWTGTTSFEVDLLHRITRTTDIRGNAAEYADDETGNQTGISCPDGTALHKAFSVALKQGIIAANPCDAAELPKVERREIVPLADDEGHSGTDAKLL